MHHAEHARLDLLFTKLLYQYNSCTLQKPLAGHRATDHRIIPLGPPRHECERDDPLHPFAWPRQHAIKSTPPPAPCPKRPCKLWRGPSQSNKSDPRSCYQRRLKMLSMHPSPTQGMQQLSALRIPHAAGSGGPVSSMSMRAAYACPNMSQPYSLQLKLLHGSSVVKRMKKPCTLALAQVPRHDTGIPFHIGAGSLMAEPLQC